MNVRQISARARIIVNQPRPVVFDAFADPEIMGRFWFTRRDDGMTEGDSIHWYIE